MAITTNRQPTNPTALAIPSNVEEISSEVAANTAEHQSDISPLSPIRGRPFKKGQSGNPKGRPKGSRNRLTDSVLKKIAEDFAEHGDEVLERVRKEEPALYLKFVISLLPRELIMQFEQHRTSEAGNLDQEDIIELAECSQTQEIAGTVCRNMSSKIN